MKILRQQSQFAPRLWLLIAWCLPCLWFSTLLLAQNNESRLQLSFPGTNAWPRLSSSFHSNRVLVLEASTNLQAWKPIAVAHDALRQYPDAASHEAQRFYRLYHFLKTATNDWKNQILGRDEAFRSPSGISSAASSRWVKFALLLEEPGRVYYQDSTKYPFHYDFASVRLAPFVGMDPHTFEMLSLYRTNQQVVLGAVLFAPGTNQVECGVQFAGLDLYSPQQITEWFKLVKATIYSSNNFSVYYMPSFEQSEVARTHAAFFESNGIPVSSSERWIVGDHCYSPGWALGRLKFFAASEIDAAFADGRLRPEDILLTDGVPAETPLVAGIISLSPSTPNSHVAILSKSFGIPFVYLSDPAERLQVQQMTNHEVVLRAEITLVGGKVSVLDMESQLTTSLRQEILALKVVPPIEFSPKTMFKAYSASTDLLSPNDIQFFGGKAANFGLLRRAVPTNSPAAIAFSFDLWDEFLDQVLPTGQSLRATITARLAPYTNYPPDIVSLKTNLTAIRKLFTDTAQFTSVQKQVITNALAVFNPQRKIRFRSSTNVEDSEHFTGAGLYDSYSGCLPDDTDSDTTGPSHCDPQEPNERGVFRAIQKVYASFYNDNAFLERLRHGVDESKVGMAVLVHHSFPDEEELANGVATLEVRVSTFGTNLFGELVTQLGAASVTNPDGNGLPEVVEISQYAENIYPTLTQFSSLVPLGAYVMQWQDDYLKLMRLLDQVAYTFYAFHSNKTRFYLDFEYKKDPTGLVVKQVREIPQQGSGAPIVPFILNEPIMYCVGQEEYGDVFANHRLKSIWNLETLTLRMITSNQVGSIYSQASVEYMDGTNRVTVSGPTTTWPGATNFINLVNYQSGVAYDFWVPNSSLFRSWQLETTLPRTVPDTAIPLLTHRDFQHILRATYATPQPRTTSAGGIFFNKVTNDVVRLVPCPVLTSTASLQQRVFTTNTFRLETSFYWPTPPIGYAAGYTAPLVRFEETRIIGLTSQPLVLRGYYSQTYRPGHHNFSEEFVFEPWLEPGMSPALLEELRQANIQQIYVHKDYFVNTGRVYLFDSQGNYRRL